MARVRAGVEWIATYPSGDRECHEPSLPDIGHTAESFVGNVRSFGHDVVFDWGNDNAWQSDFDHPDFGGDSLNWTDDVHLCYFGGHGGQFGFDGRRILALAFSSNHAPPDLAPCDTMSAQWRLGARMLKWLILDTCQMVLGTDPNHILAVWGEPMQGAHLLLGFIDLNESGVYTYRRRAEFADEICRGAGLANAWLQTGFGWDSPKDRDPKTLTRPIAIAAGESRDDAINRRDNETLDWVNSPVRATNWLAWKWRS